MSVTLTDEQLDELADLRESVADVLTEHGVPGLSYIGENPRPGSGIVIPGRQYLRWPSGDVTFDKPCVVSYDVLLLAGLDTSKRTARAVDRLIVRSIVALDAMASDSGLDGDGVTEVSQPGRLTISGATFMAAVVTTNLHHRF